MRYFGSKALVAHRIPKIADQLIGPRRVRTVCDPFGGLGMVASAFKRSGWRVTVGDHLLFPHYYQRARLARSSELSFVTLRRHLGLDTVAALETYLQNIKPRGAWLTTEFAQRRQFFTPTNAAKADELWRKIRDWRVRLWTTEDEHILLIASLIDALDKVANTAGTYYAYLKRLTRRARHPLTMTLLPHVPGRHECTCLYGDALDVVRTESTDVLYLDPPYSTRSYDRYYHLPQTLAGCQPRMTFGTAGTPKGPKIPSAFETRKTAADAIDQLLTATNATVVLFHYAADGLVPLPTIRELLRRRGNVREFRLSTLGYRTLTGSRHKLHHVLAA